MVENKMSGNDIIIGVLLFGSFCLWVFLVLFFPKKKKSEPKPLLNPCPKCGNERTVWYFDNRKHFYCPVCRIANIDLPDEVVEGYVGRVIRVLKKEFLARFLVEYPINKKGEEFWLYYGAQFCGSDFSFYVNHVYAIAGKFRDDRKFEPFYAKDLTINKEGFVSAYPSMFPDFDYRRYIPNLPKKGRFEAHPYSLVARKVVNDIARKFESYGTLLEQPRPFKAKDFERLIKDLLEKIGYINVTITGGASDKGIDLEAYIPNEKGVPTYKIIVQCKYQSPLNRIKPSQVREFAYVIEREKSKGVERGYFITSSYFSPECYDKANCGEDMELIDRDYLKKLLKKYKIPSIL